MTTAPHAVCERWVSLALILLTLLVYAQVCTHDFINLDDQTYIIENPHIRDGLTLDGIRWAFTESYASNWHPLTWLSHMLDCELFGLNPGLHHLANLLFHLASTVLLFVVFTRMTHEMWPSAMVAALFALHPLHVESVAWVAERKDVLSTFLWMLTMWAYVRYVDRKTKSWHLVALLFFALGLMSKPMLVTLPFVLLLLDVWPLGRIRPMPSEMSYAAFGRLLLEKLPFFLFASVSCVVTLWAQSRGGAIVPVSTMPISDRFGDVPVSYLRYVIKMFLPTDLAVYYPQTDSQPVWLVVLACLFFIGLCAWVGHQLKCRPYLGVGWFWYWGTLLPVIGLVQVGGQAWADRYTYIPLIGLFVMVAWGLQDLVARWRLPVHVIKIAAGVVIVACMIGTWLQLLHWRDSIALFQHTLRVTKNNSLAHFNLGCALYAQGRQEEAIIQLLEALRIEPTYAKARYNLETILADQTARVNTVTPQEAARLKPTLAYAHNQLAILFAQQGRTAQAISHFSVVVRLEPNNSMAHFNLGLAMMAEDRRPEAIAEFRETLRLQPGFTEARAHLERALKQESSGVN